MNTLAVLCTLAAVGCGPPPPAPPAPRGGAGPGGPPESPAVAAEWDRLRGEWKVLVLARGKSRQEFGREAVSNTLTVEGDTFRRNWLGRAGGMRAALDPARTPKAIDLTFLDPDGRVANTYLTHPDGRVEVDEGRVSGIYDLQGDRLTLCFPDTRKTPRPADFSAGTDPPDRTLLILQRVR